MAHSEALADRIRRALGRRRGIAEKKMFGGVGFLLSGNLCVGVWKTSLIVRLDPQDAERLLNEPHVRVFDITGRPMKGWLLVEADGLETDEQLAAWIELSRSFVRSLPANGRDAITRNLAKAISDVQAGRRKQPHRIADL